MELPKEKPTNPPLAVVEEINDNALTIEVLLEEVSEILQINLYDTLTYQDFKKILDPGTALSLYFSLSNTGTFDGSDPDRTADLYSTTLQVKDMYDLEQLWLWIKQPRLPKDFRTELVRYLCHRDELDEHIAELSQVRFERLRMWINYHV